MPRFSTWSHPLAGGPVLSRSEGRGYLYWVASGEWARHHAKDETGRVEIESQWTARRREQAGIFPTVRKHPAAERARPSKAWTGHPREFKTSAMAGATAWLDINLRVRGKAMSEIAGRDWRLNKQLTLFQQLQRRNIRALQIEITSDRA